MTFSESHNTFIQNNRVFTNIFQALKLSTTARQSSSVGEILNLMSIDAQKVHDTFADMHEIWAGPIMIIIIMAILWYVIGPACLAGLALIIILAPINGGFLVRKYAKLQVNVFNTSYLNNYIHSLGSGCLILAGKNLVSDLK